MKSNLQSNLHRINAMLLAFFMFCAVFFIVPGEQAAAATRAADVKKASKGNELVGVAGTFEYVAKNKILKRINEIRKEACKKGYLNPSTGKKLKKSDYVALKWSSDLEWIAQLRAAEATVYESHTRPNGTGCFTITHNDQQSWAEDLAWNYSGLMNGIEQWYSEKDDWVKQNTNAVTGHYTSMINPEYRYVGLGSFVRSAGGWYGVAGELSRTNTGKSTQNKLKGSYVQKMEVQTSAESKAKVSGASSIKVGATKTYRAVKTASYDGILGGTNSTEVRVLGSITWKSSDKKVATVTSSGKVTAKKAGKTVISAKLPNGKTVKKTVTVKKK